MQVACVSHLFCCVSTTTLMLVRHAHTDANEQGETPRLAGWADIPLSERGEAQLERVRELEADAADLVYSSDLHRAMITAEAVARGRRVVPLRSLREISCGIVDGWTVDEVKMRFPDQWRQNESERDPDFTWPGGESYGRFRARVVRAMRGIAKRHPGQRVIVVTHAGVISQILGIVHGLSPAAWSKWRPGNCSVTTIAWADGPRVIDFDAREHLEEPVGAERAGN